MCYFVPYLQPIVCSPALAANHNQIWNQLHACHQVKFQIAILLAVVSADSAYLDHRKLLRQRLCTKKVHVYCGGNVASSWLASGAFFVEQSSSTKGNFNSFPYNDNGLIVIKYRCP